ncbi:ABC transporter permease [uncultured Draconibacterium sp.]|uniref:ABC transporter permease n=1 Tax=uncultured Draconibacterium sp. TaxID=1573823 RepID=UPI003216C979
MLKYLIEKEFKQFFRNSFLPRIVIAMPFVATVIFPMVANYDVNNINLSIVDSDKSSYSSQLVRKVESSGYFRITDVSSTYDEALRSIELNESDVILEIPNGFEVDLVKEKETEVLISANTVNGTKGGLGSAYLSSIVADFNSQIRSELMQVTNGTLVPSFEIVPLYKFNPRLIYKLFMIPAIMIMILALVGGFLPALNIVGEKESGTIEQMNVTPVRKIHFILAKLIPYWVAGFVVLTIAFLAAWAFYGFLPVGSFLTLYLFTSLFILAISGFGLVISNYANTIQQAIFMIFFFVMTFIFMSGLYTPVASMPDWAQWLSTISPLKYIIQVFRLVYLKGSAVSDLIIPFFALTGFAIFFNGWAILSYSKKN